MRGRIETLERRIKALELGVTPYALELVEYVKGDTEWLDRVLGIEWRRRTEPPAVSYYEIEDSGDEDNNSNND